MIIEKYKNQIEEANNKIIELNGILSRLQPKENKNKQNKNKINNNKNIQQQINNNLINEEPNLHFNYSNYKTNNKIKQNSSNNNINEINNDIKKNKCKKQ